MYNGVDYPYYEPTSNNSMSWQNHNSQQPGAQQQQQSQPHPSQLPQNQSQTRFNRFNQGHHANGRDDQDHQSQEIVRIKSYTSQKYIKLPTGILQPGVIKRWYLWKNQVGELGNFISF